MAGVPVALGSAAAGAYAFKTIHDSGYSGALEQVSKTLFSKPSSVSPSTQPTEELSVLQNEVERMHRLLAEVVRGKGSQGYTVIHTGPGMSSWASFLFPGAVGFGAFVLYCKFKGWTLADCMYVTRGSLGQLKTNIMENITRIWDELQRVKVDLSGKIMAVDAMQQQLNNQQTQTDERVRQVSSRVDEIRVGTDKIVRRVEEMDEKLANMMQGVVLVNHKMDALCGLVGDVAKKVGLSNNPYAKALRGQVPGNSMLPSIPGLNSLCIAGEGGSVDDSGVGVSGSPGGSVGGGVGGVFAERSRSMHAMLMGGGMSSVSSTVTSAVNTGDGVGSGGAEIRPLWARSFHTASSTPSL